MTEATAPPSICLLRLSALGDVTHVLPLLRTLRMAWPQAAIAWSGRGAEGALTVGLVRRDLVSIHVDDTPGDQLARLSWYDATEAAHVLDNVS